MNAGYVTFVNRNDTYLRLTNILVDSVLEFSQYPIEVFGINFDYDYKPDEPRIIRRRFNIQPENFQTICFAKTFSSLNSSFEYGIQCDADMIITPEADILFEDCKTISNLPLGTLHFHDPNNQQDIMNFLGVKEKSQPYVHATYLFSKECKPFFEELFEIEMKILNKNPYIKVDNQDETLYNALLWKYNSKKYVDLYDPYYEFFVDNYINKLNKKVVSIKPEDATFNAVNNINYYICHGCKAPHVAKNIFEKIKNMHSK